MSLKGSDLGQANDQPSLLVIRLVGLDWAGLLGAVPAAKIAAKDRLFRLSSTLEDWRSSFGFDPPTRRVTVLIFHADHRRDHPHDLVFV